MTVLISRLNEFAKIFLALLSGILLFLSFPKFGTGIIAWVALVPLLYALKNTTPLQGFKLGFLTGICAHVGILYWITYVVVVYGKLPFYVGVAATLLLASYLSLYTACFSMGVVFLQNHGGILILSAPLLWTVLEFVRSRLFTGFPWENLAYSQYLSGNVIQIADVTGIYGITFAIVVVNAVLTDMITKGKKKYLWAKVASVCALIVVINYYGYFRMGEINERMEKKNPLKVSLIQGNIDQDMKWNDSYQWETVNIYRMLSLKSGSAKKGLIVWPETAMPFYFEHPGALRNAVLDIARETGRDILFGSPKYDDREGKISYGNSAYLVRPDGNVAGRYDKVHLVPYGEYVPLRKYFPFMGKLVATIGDFQPGKGFDPIEYDDGPVGVLICYEGIFPEAARAYKKRKTGLLVNITNDAWFGRTSAPYQHLSMAVFRAVENRLYLVRAANTGISAVIDPAGSIRGKTNIFERTVLNGDVKFIDVKTFYAEHGDIFVCACGILLVSYYFMLWRKKKYAGRN